MWQDLCLGAYHTEGGDMEINEVRMRTHLTRCLIIQRLKKPLPP